MPPELRSNGIGLLLGAVSKIPTVFAGAKIYENTPLERLRERLTTIFNSLCISAILYIKPTPA